jgi:FtsH-binding integral membrane protein
MHHSETAAIAFGVFCVGLGIASCVLSIMFLLMHRENRRRWLPCVSVIALPLIGVVPESGWSDVRSQWHQAALAVVWGLWALYLVFILLRAAQGRVLVALRSVLGIMGVLGFVGGTVSLVESWRFFHGL